MSLSNNRKGTEFVFILKATVKKETFIKPEILMTSWKFLKLRGNFPY